MIWQGHSITWNLVLEGETPLVGGQKTTKTRAQSSMLLIRIRAYLMIGGGLEKGTFSLGGEFPDIQDERIEFVKGLFQDTVPEVFPRVEFSRKSYWHMDADMFTSTHYALTMAFPYMKSGDIVVFDEFGVPTHEFRAFDDFTKSFPIKLEPLAAINNYLQVAFRVV